MKKILAVAALAVLGATSAIAGSIPGTGVLNSKHDINLTAGLLDDPQGRVCAFCHTPHHALVDPTGGYAPLWSHEFTSYLSGTPYASATFDAGLVGAVDPLVGPSRLCMSCHDGLVAPDQHYGLAGTAPAGRFAADDFQDPPAIAVGLNGDFSNDHPIGFRIADTLSALGPLGGDPAIYSDIVSTRTWLYAGAAGTVPISRGMYVPAGGTLAADSIMTCATCHDVHNTDNVANDAAGQQDAAHPDLVNGNYFVFAPQSGSQLCLSCHDK